MAGDPADGDATDEDAADGDAEAPGSDSATAVADGDSATGTPDGTDDQSRPGTDGDAAGDELQRALEQLDGEILDERIAAKDRAGDPRQSRGQDPAAARAGRNDATGTGTTDAGGGGQQGQAMPPGRRTVAASVPPAPRPALPLPADTPDARDEDVVARQLREAAMAETDPKMRERLWQEYERYKDSL